GGLSRLLEPGVGRGGDPAGPAEGRAVASGLRRVPCGDDRLAERAEDDRIDRVARRGQDERTREDGEGTAPRTHLILPISGDVATFGQFILAIRGAGLRRLTSVPSSASRLVRSPECGERV